MSRAASAGLLGAYRPADTFWHRRTAGFKLLALVAAGVVVVATRGPVSSIVFVAVAVGMVVWTGAGLRMLLTTLRGLLLVLVLLAIYQSWQHGWPRAVETVGDLVALVLAATVLTVTTPIDEMLDTIGWALRPLRRFGVDPDKVALAFSLMIRAIPTTIEIADQTRDAAVARGLQRSLRARLTPLVIRVVAHARATGDALHARGIGDDPTP